MPLTIRPATPSDAPVLTEIYLSAFTHDAISRLVFPRGPATTAFWTNSILEEIQDPHAHFLCVVETPSTGTNATGSDQERLIAYAKWNAPSAPHPNPDELPRWPEGGDSELADSFFGTLMRKHAEVMGDRKHWYLEILATRVEDQGKGAGGLLIKWGLEKADTDGVEAFLEASPAGTPIYKRYGFEEQQRLRVDLKEKPVNDDEFIEVFMLRKSKS